MDKFFPLWKELKGLYESVVEEDLNEARSINKIQNEWTKVTNAMKATAAEWKAAEGDAKIKLLDTLKQMTAQKKALEQMKIQLSKTRIIAPFSGVIDDIITDEGSLVSPGQSPLIRIVNLKNMYIEADVPESYVNDIVKNKKVDARLPAFHFFFSKKDF